MSTPFPLIKLNTRDVEAETYYLDAAKLIAGNPRQTLWNHYTDPTGRYFAGFWHSEPGKWHINYTEEETCHLLEGVSIVTDEAGAATTLRAGDSFVIPRGFTGTWEVVEATRKLYTIYEEPGQ
ncbi:cupin domain-containing protein [Parahaliea aestuarii]|uniref:Cupin domain-containing protein n=1 Tax=Parahaliea aestuarii TaxID=1852021 RepID=A0A5C9A4L8_9GAMM|nr:cupin domain-containing protein [Parahaliea aestuarii]TXS94964.1 cupin domain-containing protein [Parahaliea aestuarii]